MACLQEATLNEGTAMVTPISPEEVDAAVKNMNAAKLRDMTTSTPNS